MAELNYKVIRSEELSTRYEPRFVVVDISCSKVLDDAQGYGYKTPQKAHAAWAHKTRSPAKKSHDAKAKRAVEKWLKANPDTANDLENIAFHAAKEGRDADFNAKFIEEYLAENGFHDLPFSAKEFLKYW